MPSPIAHLAAGYVIYRIQKQFAKHTETSTRKASLGMLIATAVFSMLPDADAIAGLLFSDMLAFHNNLTHSLVAGLIVGLVTGGGIWAWKRRGFLRWFTLATVCYTTHVLLDYCTQGRGVMLLWPFSSDRYTAPFSLFVGVRWDSGLLDIAHVWTIANELLFALVMLLVVRGVLWVFLRSSPRYQAMSQSRQRESREA
jgi:membrane-bound metal-dependent hydrolase YbcI (DUF457 family)